MIKQVEKIVQRGDYYEIEVTEDAFTTNKTPKKEQSQISTPAIPEIIKLQLPSYQQARSNYFYLSHPSYDTANPNELLHELEDILNHQKLADQDKEQIVKLIREIKQLKEQPLVPLTDLTLQNVKQNNHQKINTVQLKMKIDLTDLQKRIDLLEGFSYPEISKLEHQLEVLLGQKKTTPSVPASKEERAKQDIQNLFALFSGLKCVDNIPAIIDRIHGSNSKYVEMEDWSSKVQNTIEFHSDFLAQLKQDELLLQKLSSNFEKNVSAVRSILSKLNQSNK